jgi:transcriptional regulator of acetoin/glycerol metabolism
VVARRAVGAGRVIRPSDIEFLHAPRARCATRAGSGCPSLRDAERAHISACSRPCWNKKEAARVLDISRGTLYRKIVRTEYGLEPDMTQT